MTKTKLNTTTRENMGNSFELKKTVVAWRKVKMKKD